MNKVRLMGEFTIEEFDKLSEQFGMSEEKKGRKYIINEKLRRIELTFKTTSDYQKDSYFDCYIEDKNGGITIFTTHEIGGYKEISYNKNEVISIEKMYYKKED